MTTGSECLGPGDGTRRLDAAGQRLVEDNRRFGLWLLGKLARRYRWLSRADQECLESAAYVGLCRAALRWRPDLGASFRTYAAHWVLTEVQRAVAHSGSISLPRGLIIARLERMSAGVAAARRVALTAAADIESLPLASRTRQGADSAWTGELLATLPSQEARVLRLVYLDGLSHAEVARNLGISRPRVTQLVHRGIRRLRRRVSPAAA